MFLDKSSSTTKSDVHEYLVVRVIFRDYALTNLSSKIAA
jgi:hypothetical protein